MIAMTRAILAGTAVAFALAATPASAGLWENGWTNGWNNGWANGFNNGWQNGLNSNGASLNAGNFNGVGSGQTVPAGNQALRVIGIELPR
jgi:hypothetical protein